MGLVLLGKKECSKKHQKCAEHLWGEHLLDDTEITHQSGRVRRDVPDVPRFAPNHPWDTSEARRPPDSFLCSLLIS